MEESHAVMWPARGRFALPVVWEQGDCPAVLCCAAARYHSTLASGGSRSADFAKPPFCVVLLGTFEHWATKITSILA